MAIEADATDKAVATDEVHKADKAIKAIESPLDGDGADADNKIHLVDKADEVYKINKARFNLTIVANAICNIIHVIVAADEANWFCRC